VYASEVIKREREGMNVYSIERKKNEIVPGIERKRERLRVYASEREREREKERERKREREIARARDIVHFIHMGWLRSVGSIKSWVFFAKEPYKRDAILQKRPVI